MAKKQAEQRKDEEAIVEANKDLLVEIQKAYDAENVLSTEVKARLDFLMREHADIFTGAFVYPVASRQREPRFAYLALGERNKFAMMAEDWSELTKRSGHIPREYSRPEAEDCLRALNVKIDAPQGDIVSMTLSLTRRRNMPGNLVRQWVEHTGLFADRSHSGREGKKGEVAAAISEMSGKPVDPKAELEAQLTEAKARKAEALKAEDADALKSAKAEIARLEAELAKLEKPAETKPDPNAVLEAQLTEAKARKTKALEAEDADELKAAKAEIVKIEAELAKLAEKTKPDESKLDKAVAYCTGPGAKKGAKLFYARWEKDEIDDEAFVAGVEAILAD